MTEHVKYVVKSINFHLRNIYRIRRFITFESCNHLARSLILSCLDYANLTFFCISTTDLRKLQTLQNRAAKAIFRLGRMHPSATLLKQLHWLPVDTRMIFKLMLLTFIRYHGLCYLMYVIFSSIIFQKRPNLRSGDDKLLLQIPRPSRTLGDKSFSFNESVWDKEKKTPFKHFFNT